MDRSWKVFIKIVAALLSVIIVCVAINVSVNKVTAGITDMDSASGENGQSGYNDAGQNQGYVQQKQDAGMNTDMDSNDLTNGGSAVVPNQNGSQPVTPSANGSTGGNQGAAQQNGENPLTYNKNQIVAYYNNCLRKTYSQPKFTVTKTEKIDVQLGELKVDGKKTDTLQGMANKIVASNAAKGGTKTQSFTNKTAVVDAQKRFILPAGMTSSGVKGFNVSKNGAGYVINFTLNQESCDFTQKPPYNASCTFPLDFTEIDLGGFGEITSAQFNYPGTTLTAYIDGQGRVSKTYVVMPLYVNNASGVGKGITAGHSVSVNISGKWTCTNSNTF